MLAAFASSTPTHSHTHISCPVIRTGESVLNYQEPDQIYHRKYHASFIYIIVTFLNKRWGCCQMWSKVVQENDTIYGHLVSRCAVSTLASVNKKSEGSRSTPVKANVCVRWLYLTSERFHYSAHSCSLTTLMRLRDTILLHDCVFMA